MDNYLCESLLSFCIATLNETPVLMCHISFLQLSGTLTVPFWQWFLSKFGKKMAVYVGITVSNRLDSSDSNS